MLDSTIAAIATAPGEAGIGIVRVSGDKAIDILKEVFKPKKNIVVDEIPNRSVTYGYIQDEGGVTIDEVLTVIMKKPYSYTTEDIVEIHCHGGIIPVRKIMELVLRKGALLAEPGEFTKRAFINGRIDLAQAEAVIDIITSKTEAGLNAAVNQLEGELSSEIRRIMNDLLSMIAHIEASIDFPEHDIEELTVERLYNMALEVAASIKVLIESFDEGKIVRDGLGTAIVGRPNVGKSSLLNILLKENRAIVTDIPGTTRDIIEEYLNIGGILIRLVDTAGIRETEDIVEKIGVERTKDVIREAELVIVVLDGANPLQTEDYSIMDLVCHKQVIIAVNKIDLGVKVDIEMIKDRFGGDSLIEMSVKNRTGIDELENKIKELIFRGQLSINKNKMVTNIRHKDLLVKAYDSIKKAVESLKSGIPVDLISVDIRDCWSKLGMITGDTIEEDIMKEIFSKFCIGK